MEQNSKEMTKLAIAALEDKKAEDIHVIDISEASINETTKAITYTYGNKEKTRLPYAFKNRRMLRPFNICTFRLAFFLKIIFY